MKVNRRAALRVMLAMTSVMLASGISGLTSYASTIRQGVSVKAQREMEVGPGYTSVTVDHKAANDTEKIVAGNTTIDDAIINGNENKTAVENTMVGGSYDYTTPVKSDDEAWADLQKAPAGGGNKGGWGNSYSGANSIPRGNIDEATMHTYGGYSRSSDTTSKVIYLTFDEGYENGYTPAFLDVLKKHGIHGTFFVTGSYLKSQPDLVKRMVAEGHIVGNHTMKHPSMATITTHEAFWNQLKSNSDLFYQTTGYQMPRFYRSPEGSVSTAQLQEAQAMGYRTILWSVAHLDWNVKKQPSRETALATLNRRIHPGAIVLLHCVSSTNASILDELLTGWEQQGYTFSTLDKIS